MKKLGIIILFFFCGFYQAQANCTTGLVSAPIVDFIAVDAAGNVTLSWQPVLDPDGIIRYNIYTVNLITGATDSVDFVLGNQTTFTLPAGHPLNTSNTSSIELSVAAIDACEIASLTATNRHNSILLKDTFDVCNAAINLEWSAYDDFNSGTDVGYNIYVKINGGGYNLYGSTFLLDTVYTNVVQGDNYEFYIEGVENNGAGPISSTSNYEITNTSEALVEPTFTYLSTASVLDSTSISVQFYVDTAADIRSYKIKRATSLTGNYTTVGSVGAFRGMNPGVFYTDNNELNANQNYYFYTIEPEDICYAAKPTSNIARTSWVTVESNPLEAKNILKITPYDGWLGGVKEYELYRAVAGVWESNPIAVFPAFNDTLVYEDDITTAFYGDGEFCYKLEVKEFDVPHVYNVPAATSTSNVACALHEPVLFVPNAFIPSGTRNPVFKPVLTFSDPTAYLFQIYNKWGEVIFETNDVTEAWDGTINRSSSLSPQDVYIYLIEFVSATGDEYSKRGKVTLLR